MGGAGAAQTRGGGGDAFSGVGSARSTNVDSQRGAASRSAAGTGRSTQSMHSGARSQGMQGGAARSGGARAGGGGGGGGRRR